MTGMESLGLVVGHLIGDYIVQNDWMAANKGIPHPGEKPLENEPMSSALWAMDCERWHIGHFACFTHCLCYTLAVWACSFWWMPWWGLAVCFVVHFPIDRFRLAGWWMRNVSGQKAFADGPLSPWSIIVVDNTIHLATLFVIGVASGVNGI